MTDAHDFALAPLTRFGTVFGWGLARTFRTKKFLVVSLLAVVGGLCLGWLTKASRQPILSFWETLDNAFLGIAVPLIALAMVGGGYGEEVQDQTLVYHLVRPVSRTTVFLARYAAGVVPGTVAGAALVVSGCLAANVGVSKGTIAETAGLAALGVATVGALYYALAALFKRGLIAGLVYTFVVEGFFQFLPGSVRQLSLMHHVRSIYHRWTDDAFAAVSKDVARVIEAASQKVMGEVSPLAPAEEPWTSVSTALLLCVGVVAVSLWLGARTIARRDFALKD